MAHVGHSITMKEKIKDWIENFVSVHNIALGQIPCPFAKQAMIKDTIRYVPVTAHTAVSKIETYAYLWDDRYEVAVFYFQDEISPESLSGIAENFNRRFMERDFVVLEDHPDDVEILNGVEMNFGECPLILLQRLSKLNKASDQLKKRGYYDNWPEESYDDVVKWRYK